MSADTPANGLTSLTLAEASAKIYVGAVTSTQLTEACLARIAIYAPKDLYQPTTRKRLEQDALVNESAPEYIRQYEAQEPLRRTIDDAFTDFDLIVMPTLKSEPPVLDDVIRRIS